SARGASLSIICATGGETPPLPPTPPGRGPVPPWRCRSPGTSSTSRSAPTTSPSPTPWRGSPIWLAIHGRNSARRKRRFRTARRRASGAVSGGRSLFPALSLLLGVDALAQRVHDRHDIVRTRRRLVPGGRFRLFLALACGDDRLQPLLHRILDQFRLPRGPALLDQLADQFHRLVVGLLRVDAGKIVLGIAHLVAIAERPDDDALAARLEHDRAFAAIEDEARNADRVGRRHRLADDRERLLGDLV